MSTKHLVHWNCPEVKDRDSEVIALCGSRTLWVDEMALKCPVCLDISQHVECPMCGVTVGVLEA